MLKNLISIKRKITQLDAKSVTFKKTRLTGDEQINIRSKPLPYLKHTVELFNFIEGKTIVELGCMRRPLMHDIDGFNPICCNDGHSKLTWAKTNASVFSVDIDRAAVRCAKKYCKPYKNCKIIKKDALQFLSKFKLSIDLLYLDAWDVLEGSYYAENHLIAYLIAKPNLSQKNIISIDDTDIANGGKGKYLFQILETDGYTRLSAGRQSIFINF